MIDLKTSITKTLKTTGLNVYDATDMDKDAILPYITYNISNGNEGSTDNTENVDLILEINILDNNLEKDTTWVETNLNVVDALMNNKTVIESEFYWFARRFNVLLDLPTVDEFTFRREIQYNLKTYISEV